VRTTLLRVLTGKSLCVNNHYCIRRSPFLGQGVNQALQDAYCLGTLIARANSLSYNESDLKTASHTLQDIARRYQSVRQPPTALLSLESSFLGQLETARGPVGGFLRDCFLRGMSATGLAGLAYVTSAIPRIE
jgi:2-polyprenyl-6-methoxyphenol hydroxylase-like FAD-dependent oxidoreductase